MSGMQDFSKAGLKNRAKERIERKIVVAIQGHTLCGRDNGSCLPREKSNSENESEVDIFLSSMVVLSLFENTTKLLAAFGSRELQ